MPQRSQRTANGNGGEDVYGNGKRPTARTQRTANSNGNGNGFFLTTENTEDTEINDNGSSE